MLLNAWIQVENLQSNLQIWRICVHVSLCPQMCVQQFTNKIKIYKCEKIIVCVQFFNSYVM